MKALVLSVLMLSTVFAFGSDDRIAPACGLNGVHFDVSTTKQSSPAPAPSSGKALVYFIQDDTKFESRPRPTVRFAVDGSWVGATRANSWFALQVEPGVHHICADWQKKVVLFSVIPEAAAAHFTAQAGQIYYFRMRDRWNKLDGLSIKLAPLDTDEGPILLREFSVSTSHPKK